MMCQNLLIGFQNKFWNHKDFAGAYKEFESSHGQELKRCDSFQRGQEQNLHDCNLS
jgi:hypothetical protein